jgi:hypothetical protein
MSVENFIVVGLKYHGLESVSPLLRNSGHVGKERIACCVITLAFTTCSYSLISKTVIFF